MGKLKYAGYDGVEHAACETGIVHHCRPGGAMAD